MTDQVSAHGVISKADAAEERRIAEALERLVPSLERFEATQRDGQYPAYIPGTVPSEGQPLPEAGVGLDATIDELAIAVEHGCRITAPGFFGFITTGPTTAGIAAHTAVAAAGGQRYLSHAFNALEWTGLRWLAELCGLPADAHGVFASGGSTANLLALGAARQWAFERRIIDVSSDGLPAGVQARIYASGRAHRTIHRAAAVLGLGRSAVAEVPSDRTGRINVAALDSILRADAAKGIVPVAVVAIAGSTDTGWVDPIADVVEVGHAHNCWVHVDGAYGLVANCVPELAALFDGVADADSWIVDPHKWLSTGLGIGATYVRDADVLTRAFAEGHAAYLEGSFATEPDAVTSQFDAIGGPWADQSMELSAPPRGALVWTVLREIGRAGVRKRIARDVGYAHHVAERVRNDPHLELLCDAQLSIVCFRYAPPAGVDGDKLNAVILERLRRETPFIPTSTVVDGVLAIRPCFIVPRTTQEDVDGMVDAVLRIGAEVVAEA